MRLYACRSTVSSRISLEQAALSAVRELPGAAASSNLLADVEDGILDVPAEKTASALQTFEALSVFAALPIAVITGAYHWSGPRLL